MKRLRRNRFPLISLALLVILFAGWITLQSFSNSSQINSANFVRIKKGMTEEEVYSILGEPTPVRSVAFYPRKAMVWFSSAQPWVTNETIIVIIFDQDGWVEEADLSVNKRSLKERFEKYLPSPALQKTIAVR